MDCLIWSSLVMERPYHRLNAAATLTHIGIEPSSPACREIPVDDQLDYSMAVRPVDFLAALHHHQSDLGQKRPGGRLQQRRRTRRIARLAGHREILREPPDFDAIAPVRADEDPIGFGQPAARRYQAGPEKQNSRQPPHARHPTPRSCRQSDALKAGRANSRLWSITAPKPASSGVTRIAGKSAQADLPFAVVGLYSWVELRGSALGEITEIEVREGTDARAVWTAPLS